MATTQQLAQAEAEFERANEALNDARTAVIRAERRLNLAREAGSDVDPGLLAQATQNLNTAQSNFRTADAAYTAAQQNFQAVFDAVEDTAASPVDPVVITTESVTAAQQPRSVPLRQIDLSPTAASAADPEVSAIQTTGGVPSGQIVRAPAPTPAAIEDDIEGGAVGFSEDEFAGNGYGFTYNNDGELLPFDPEASRVENTNADTEDTFAGNGYGFVYNDDGELVPDDGVLRPDNFDPEAVSPDSDPAADTGRFATATADDIAGTDVRFEPRPPLDELTYQDNGDGTGYTIFDGDGNQVTVVATEQEAILYIENAAFDSVGFADAEEAEEEGGAVGGILPTTQQSEAQIQAARQRAQAQEAMARQRAQASQGDWRVKLRLAGAADYLYKSSSPGILAPLAVTDGVIFPYTPSITSGYRANYSSYDLTHSNYRGYFYTGSTVEAVQIQATFTAQDTAEADYVLAVIQFFRSVTKMFYGQDANRGVPPPLVFLQGLGQFQYNLHPCVVSSFNYTTPTDVDYIRAGVTTISGAGFLRARQRQTTTTFNPLDPSESRRASLGQNVQPGAQTQPPSPPTIGTQDPTYVPTKLDIQVELLPMQTRQQVSEQFSLDKFANGDLVKGGFW